MVNLKTYASSAGGGDTSGLVPYTNGTTNITIAHSIEIDSDSEKLYLGDGQDASIYYDGTDLIINAKEVGTGVVKINGGFAFNNVVALVQSTTPSVGNGNIFQMGGALPRGTSVTNFTNGEEGQIIIFRATNAAVTIINSASHIQLQGSVNFAMGNGDNITLVKFATKWEEISRTEM
jgi:hypothetical protein